jgi:hypothetical protein
MFTFDPQGLLISPDDTDNPDNHVVLHHDAGTMVSFAVINVGDEPGACHVDIFVDDQFVTDWDSSDIGPGQSQSPPFVRGLGRYPSGRHTFRADLSPGAGRIDQVSNEVDID